jgi:hypothetical protein
MILYVNGDSHTAAAEAVNPHAFAEDDGDLFYMGRAPHPANLAVSWGKILSTTIKATFKCDAESASSNHRILRTTEQWLSDTDYDPREIFMIIQWSTWEREEWLIDGIYYQINASGQDHVPDSHRDRYKDFIASVDWDTCTKDWHDKIWALHRRLEDLGVRHVFFNGNNHFASISSDQRQDWGTAYVGPYDPAQTWDQWLRNNRFDTVAPNSWHFGRDAHAAWARFMLQYVIRNKLVT